MPGASTVLAQAAVLPRRVRRAVENEWRQAVARLPVRGDTVLYEAFGGRGVLCHPEAIFRELLAAEDLQHLEHVWALLDPSGDLAVVREFRDHPRVRFVRHGSYEYTRALATAGFLVNNATFRPSFAKREGQVYLNTWHGTPLKRMGHHEPGETAATRNVLRNFLMCDFVVSGSPYMTSQMYESAYRLVNVYPGKVIETGNPRTDRQVLTPDERLRVRRSIGDAATAPTAASRVVLYAPTWRGASFAEARDDALELLARVQEMAAALGDGYRVVLKVHQQVFALAAEHPELRPFLVPNDIPSNVVLGAVDVLVTDFSSILFDALVTDLPTVFLAPDLDEYAGQRGLYLDVAELPGPLVGDAASAAHLVAAAGTGGAADPLVSHARERAAARERFAPHDDGGAAARVVDIVFRSRTSGAAVHDIARDGRETVLVYLGGLKSNGITTSALNLLRHIDTDRFDVTAVYRHAAGGARAANARAIPDSVRRLARIGAFTHGKAHRRKRRRLLDHGARMSPQDLHTMLELLRGEWRRCVGGAQFDYVVDFSGYAPFWSFLMAVAPTRSRSIWLHNDLRADQMREVAGERPFENHLGAVFSSYTYYDHLVSVSPALRDINARQLAEFAPPEKFVAARNTIDAARVLAGAAPGPRHDEWPGDHLLAPLASDEGEEAPTADVIAAQHGRPDLAAEVARRLAVRHGPRRPGVTQFVTVGRISPEKNHARLLRAFATVHREHPATRLVVVGDGPLRQAAELLARDLGLADAVRFTGLLQNPWALMAECDAFVLSSDYEGQPMVILEALVLGLPVVTTAFGSVESALPAGCGLVVERSDEALADGLTAALRREVPAPAFDADAYNAEVMAEFYRAIGAA